MSKPTSMLKSRFLRMCSCVQACECIRVLVSVCVFFSPSHLFVSRIQPSPPCTGARGKFGAAPPAAGSSGEASRAQPKRVRRASRPLMVHMSPGDAAVHTYITIMDKKVQRRTLLSWLRSSFIPLAVLVFHASLLYLSLSLQFSSSFIHFLF